MVAGRAPAAFGGAARRTGALAGAWLAGGVHRGALLGIWGATSRRDERVSGRASALAGVPGRGGVLRVRRGGSLRGSIRAVSRSRAEFRVCCCWLGYRGAQGPAAR